MAKPQILVLDIETAPSVAHVWGLFKETIPIDRLVKPGYTLCFSAKWLGKPGVIQASCAGGSHLEMLKSVHALLDKADIVIHYNGRKFDIPTLNREFIKHGLGPPAPYQQIDLLTVVRRQFKFQSNKLDFVARQLGLGAKAQHKGYALWLGCMADDPKAWREMLAYNKQDVRLTERLYGKLRPWIVDHPNVALIRGDGVDVCTTCGGHHLQRRGYATTKAGRYARYHCQDCGSWLRGRQRERQARTLTVAR